MNTPAFTLDPILAADSEFVADLPLSQLRLMDDARFPWLLLIPRLPNVAELVNLLREDQIRLLDEINLAAAALRMTDWPRGPVEKLNVAALGNQVRQLHIHVIGRRSDDAAWPGPVWSAGPRSPFAAEERAALAAAVARTLPPQAG